MDPQQTPKARATRLRAALKEAFDGHKFGVTSRNTGSDYGWITVRWHDGPTRDAVRAVAEPYGSATERGHGLELVRAYSPGVQAEADRIWDEAAAPTPEKKVYADTNEGHGHYHAWDHEGREVPAGTETSQKQWLIDHVILAAQGHGTAHPGPTEPEPEHTRPATDGAQRKWTVLGLLDVMAQHVKALPDEVFEPPTSDGQTERLGVLVAGATLAEVSALYAAVQTAVRRPDKAEAATALVDDTVTRLATGQNPVLRSIAQKRKEAGQ
ncbi:LPD29 domain-containing protein [Streptomyces albogriseolus]|uniref:LPD29 domain-containing protein n=1 Tax=Streptomyces albogriseolus TaxID=1887 RepID=UPI003460C3B1